MSDIFDTYFSDCDLDIAMEAPDAAQAGQQAAQNLNNDTNANDPSANIASFNNPQQTVQDAQNDQTDESPEEAPDDMNMDEGGDMSDGGDMGDGMGGGDVGGGSTPEDEATKPDPPDVAGKKRVHINVVALYDAVCNNLKSFNTIQPLSSSDRIDESYYIIQKDLEELKAIIYQFATEELNKAEYGTAMRKYKTFMEIYSIIINMVNEYMDERKKNTAQ